MLTPTLTIFASEGSQNLVNDEPVREPTLDELMGEPVRKKLTHTNNNSVADLSLIKNTICMNKRKKKKKTKQRNLFGGIVEDNHTRSSLFHLCE